MALGSRDKSRDGAERKRVQNGKKLLSLWYGMGLSEILEK